MDNFNYGEALQKSFLFYEAQRSGKLPEDNRIVWRGDSALDDGSDVGLDLSDGYYDAGDHVKFGLPMSTAMATLAWGGIEYETVYKQTGQWDELLDALKWGTDWILKAHVNPNGETEEVYVQVGDGAIDHKVWTTAQNLPMPRTSFKIDRENPGTDLAASYSAALASTSILFRGIDDVYADRLVEEAIQLYNFADTYRAKYSDSVPEVNPEYTSYSGFTDELIWGANWLYRATDDQQYLDLAKQYAEEFNIYPGNGTLSWDDKTAGSAIMLAQTGDERYITIAENWLNNWLPSGTAATYTEGGFAWNIRWGSLRNTASTAFLASVFDQTIEDKPEYEEFIKSQVDYMLGDNPRNSSYVVGFGDNFPERVHHRTASGSSFNNNNFTEERPNEHVIYGALVGGPKSADDFDYEDDRGDAVANEVALDYNSAYTGALAYLYQEFGGEPLSDRELDALPGIDLNLPPLETIGEIITLDNFNHIEQTVQLQHDYINPVVIAQPISFKGRDPSTVRITNINAAEDTLSLHLQEPEYLSGLHVRESVSLLVLEAGEWELEDGTLLEVGTVDTNETTARGNSSWEDINFDSEFADTPVVMTQVQTNNDPEFVRTRQRNADSNGFSVALEEEEALRNSGHGTETIGYLAIESSSGEWNGFQYQAENTGDNVNSAWKDLSFEQFDTVPNLLASIASFDGPDPAGLRYREVGQGEETRIQIKIEEDRSLDNETFHTTEEVNFLAIAGNGLLTAQAVTPTEEFVAEDSAIEAI